VPAALGEEAAENLQLESGQIAEAGRAPEPMLEIARELAQVARVGGERVIGGAALVCEVCEPVRDCRREIAAERQLGAIQLPLSKSVSHHHLCPPCGELRGSAVNKS
jgi:hypothetical protein